MPSPLVNGKNNISAEAVLREQLSAYHRPEVSRRILGDSLSAIPRDIERLIGNLRKTERLDYVYSAPTFHDVPRFFQYAAVASIKGKTDGYDVSCSGYGIGRDRRPALMKAIAEALERSLFATYRKGDFWRGKFKDLPSPGLDPANLINFSPEQLREKRFAPHRVTDDSIFYWVRGTDFLNGRQVWIPAQLGFWNYHFEDGEPILVEPITNGQAAGASKSQAIVEALLEVIERDAFMLYWLRRIPPVAVDLEALSAKYKIIRQLTEEFDRYRLSLNVSYLPTEFKMPVYIAVIRDFSGVGSAVSIGGACSFDSIGAIEKAVLEALSVYHAVRRWRIEDQGHLPPADSRAYVSPLGRRDRLLLWSRPEMLPKIEWFVKGNGERLMDVLELGHTSNVAVELERLRSALGRCGMGCYYIDATPDDLRKLGFWFIKTIVPGSIPIYLDETKPHLGSPRLYRSYSAGLPAGDWNPVPHPFP